MSTSAVEIVRAGPHYGAEYRRVGILEQIRPVRAWCDLLNLHRGYFPIIADYICGVRAQARFRGSGRLGQAASIFLWSPPECLSNDCAKLIPIVIGPTCVWGENAGSCNRTQGCEREAGTLRCEVTFRRRGL
jgi:hypothetical protein